MDCPVCKNAMITLELNDVEIDHCLSCSGIWLDSGELEMLLGDSGQAKDLLDSFRTAEKCREKPRKCPICLKKMAKILVGEGETSKLIDKCRFDHGLWFDKGELNDIFEIARFDEGHKVGELLKDMFARNSGGDQ